MKAIITVDVPEHQIGQEVSVYFKDTMCVKGVCTPLTESDDAVSREAVDDVIHHYKNNIDCQLSYLTDSLWELPSVQPKRDKGEWIEHDWEELREKGYYRCSVCGCGYQRFIYGVRKSDVPYIDGQTFTSHKVDNFCPNCGADMRGEE